MTVNVCPPTVIVPVRCTVVMLGATLNVTVPLPDPVALVIVIQLTLLDAVQAQPLAVVTLNEPLPPSDGTDCDVGAIV